MNHKISSTTLQSTETLSHKKNYHKIIILDKAFLVINMMQTKNNARKKVQTS